MIKYRIRLATDKDKWTVLEWRNHEDVRAVMLTEHFISKEEHHEWWDKTIRSEKHQILLFEKDDKPVGVITIYAWNRQESSAWWGFYLDNANLLQGEKTSTWLELEQAIIQYADQELKIHELYCESLRSNQLAWSLHQKCGFVECSIPNSATDTLKGVIYMKYVYPHNKADNRASLFIFASHNTDFLVDILDKEAQVYVQFPYQVKQTSFAQYQLDLLNTDNVPINAENACYMFVERVEDFFPDIYTAVTEEILLSIEERVHQYLSFVKQISLRKNKVYIADFALQKGFPHTVEERLGGSSLNILIDHWNQTIYKLKDKMDIEIIPYANLLSQVGQAFSNKYWYMARAPFNLTCLKAYSRMIIGVIFATHSLSARVLVLDLDNTLWKGIIGDDGIQGVILGGDYPGNIYKDLQALYQTLKERGILLTICSKNTEEVALEAIEQHPEMCLLKSDFVTWRINWEKKSSNIKELAQELNIGVQSLCFIDDNPVEREEVRLNVPGIFVPELPEDPAEWYQFISTLPELWLTDVSESDKRRAGLYKKRVDIQKIESNFTDKRAFLSGLDMQLEVEPLNEQNFERTYQLFNKTNQFNTTTKRYSREELKDLASSKDSTVLHVKSKDKYSKVFEGVACLVLLKQDSDDWVIDNFVMSCRVMGRELENILLSRILLYAQENGAKRVIGRFIASQKNKPVTGLYEKNKFLLKNDEWQFDFTGELASGEESIAKLNWLIEENK